MKKQIGILIGTVLEQQMGILNDSFNADRITYSFVAQSEEEVEMLDILITKYGIENYRFFPYFNGDNMDFFRDNIFLDKDAITTSAPDMNDILERETLNSNYFRKLGVLSDKSVHANFNHSKIGTLGKDHIMDMVYKELHKGKSWAAVRKKVSPCKSCTLNSLCPPISNYEYAVGRYNLCHVKD